MRSEEVVVHRRLHVREVQHELAGECPPQRVLREVVEARVEVVDLTQNRLFRLLLGEVGQVLRGLAEPADGRRLEDLLLAEVQEAGGFRPATEARHDVRGAVRHVGASDGARSAHHVPLDGRLRVIDGGRATEHRKLLWGGEAFHETAKHRWLEETDLRDLGHGGCPFLRQS